MNVCLQILWEKTRTWPSWKQLPRRVNLTKLQTLASPFQIYWVSQKVCFIFFHKIKYTLSFSPITLLIWIFWVCRLSPTWYKVDCSQIMTRFALYQLQLVYPAMEHCPGRNPQHKTSQTTFDTFDQSQHFLHTLHKSLCFSCAFTFLEIMKHNIPECCIFSSIFNIKMVTQKIHQFW